MNRPRWRFVRWLAKYIDALMKLGGNPDAAKAGFSEQSALIDSLEESGTKGVGDLKHGAHHRSGNESKNPRSSVFIGGQNSCGPLNQYLAEAFSPVDLGRNRWI